MELEMRRTTGPIMVQCDLRFNGLRSTSQPPNRTVFLQQGRCIGQNLRRTGT
jgi:hypothetical protein